MNRRTEPSCAPCTDHRCHDCGDCTGHGCHYQHDHLDELTQEQYQSWKEAR